MQRNHATPCPIGPVFASFLYAISAGILFPACESSGTGGTATGGAKLGGTTSAGGQTNTGGVTPTGGVAPTGGGAPSGGATTPTGGVAPAGGVTSEGGVAPTGGVTTPTGGVTSPGGTTGRGGGTTGRGGGSTSGGVAATGGVTSTGGATPTGGKLQGSTGAGHYQMENLDRGVVAVMVTGGVYVGWRMFGYEYDTTASNVSYNLYKDGTKLANVTDSTNYLDAAGTATSSYAVSAVIKGTEGPQSPAVTPWAQNYLSIPISAPAKGPNGGSYSANDGSTGDLDGDGKLDIVLKWDPSNSHDNAQTGITDSCIIDGYTTAGKQLWRIDLGPNIRAGAHYTQFSVYDFDGDGKAEVAMKTAPGTKDGTGAYLSTGPAATDDDSVVYRSSSGTILTGPEYMTVFAGDTGKELATIDYAVPRGGDGSAWGDSTGNRVDRFVGGAAFVKEGGVATGLPSIIQERGYYTRMTVTSYTFRAGVLAQNWIYDSVTAIPNGGGDHWSAAADVDADGAQEVITGTTTINSDGTFRCSAAMGHGDAMHVSELVVGKGISVFSVHENLGGQDCHDASTCSIYFKVTGGGDNGRGVAEYVSASNTTAANCNGVSCATGGSTSGSTGNNFLIYWDADEPRETENATSISKSGGGTLLSCSECASNNGTKSTPTLTADLLGDWREELILRESSNAALRVFTTTDVTKRRIYTLMHDPTYRMQAVFEQSTYNQPPHVGFHIGTGMADPPKPDVFVK